jgi:hypothetical protein
MSTTGYKARFDTDAVVRLSDNMIIGPEHVEEWADYQAWLAEGNVVEDPDPIPYMPPLTVSIASASNPDLNGDYPYGTEVQQKISSILLYIQMNYAFPGNSNTLDWPDFGMNIHTFTSVQQFKDFANAIVEFSINASNKVPVPLPINIP